MSHTEIPKENTSSSSEDMQEANATGDNNNEQGQASFITGSTTAGGSDYGQGSSHLSGQSYLQGDTANSGSNYDNEGGKLGSSSVGTSNEGSSSPSAVADQSGGGNEEKAHSSNEGREREQKVDVKLKHTEAGPTDNTSSSERQERGSWSQNSIDHS